MIGLREINCRQFVDNFLSVFFYQAKLKEKEKEVKKEGQWIENVSFFFKGVYHVTLFFVLC